MVLKFSSLFRTVRLLLLLTYSNPFPKPLNPKPFKPLHPTEAQQRRHKAADGLSSLGPHLAGRP